MKATGEMINNALEQFFENHKIIYAQQKSIIQSQENVIGSQQRIIEEGQKMLAEYQQAGLRLMKLLTDRLSEEENLKYRFNELNNDDELSNRINENHKLILLLQNVAPEILQRYPCIEKVLDKHDLYFTALANKVNLDNTPWFSRSDQSKLFIVCRPTNNNQYSLVTDIEDNITSADFPLLEVDYDCTGLEAIEACFEGNFTIELPVTIAGREAMLADMRSCLSRYICELICRKLQNQPKTKELNNEN